MRIVGRWGDGWIASLGIFGGLGGLVGRRRMGGGLGELGVVLGFIWNVMGRVLVLSVQYSSSCSYQVNQIYFVESKEEVILLKLYTMAENTKSK